MEDFAQQVEAIFQSYREWSERKDHLRNHPDQATPEDINKLITENATVATLIPASMFDNDVPTMGALQQAWSELDDFHKHEYIPGCPICRLAGVCKKIINNFEKKIK